MAYHDDRAHPEIRWLHVVWGLPAQYEMRCFATGIQKLVDVLSDTPLGLTERKSPHTYMPTDQPETRRSAANDPRILPLPQDYRRHGQMKYHQLQVRTKEEAAFAQVGLMLP